MASSRTPAVISPLDPHMGLDIARSLHGRGIPVYALDHDRQAVGKYSRACKLAACADPLQDEPAYVRGLIEFGRTLSCKPVLFPLSDEHVVAISRNREILADYYDFVMPAHETIEALGSKAGLADVARKLGVPAPLTVCPSSFDEVERLASELPYPVIIKPAQSPQWHNAITEQQFRSGLLEGRAKVVLCRNAAELKEIYCILAALSPSLIVQEVIPGEDSRLFYVSFYMDRQSRPLAAFGGRKDRVLPVGFGSASFVHSVHDPLLIESGLRVLAGVQYQGLGGVEFKKDARDETYKLIEVNTRFGMWDGLAAKCGVDMAYIAYCDTLGLCVEPQMSYRSGVIWLDWQRDLRAAVAYRRAGKINWRAWLASLGGEKQLAIYSLADPLPGLFFTFQLIGTFFRRLFASHRHN